MNVTTFRRRIYLVNRGVQFRLIIYGLFVGLITASFTAFLFSALYRGVFSFEPQRMGVYVVLGLVTFFTTFFLGLIVSGQIAGPIFRLERNLRRIANGEKPEPIYLRKGDAYGELFEAYNQAITKWPSERSASVKNGFTLIEMLMVIVIIGAIGATAAYSMRFNGSNTFSVQKANVLDLLTNARNMAHVRSECVQVQINKGVLTAASYAADSGRTCAGPFSGPKQTLPKLDLAAEHIVISPLSTGASDIVFNTVGGLANDVMTTFTLTDNYGAKANVRIYPAIGQIRVN